VGPMRVHASRRTTGSARWIRPAARDQLACQRKKRRWRHEQRRLPRPTRQCAAEGSQQRPISWRQRGCGVKKLRSVPERLMLRRGATRSKDGGGPRGGRAEVDAAGALRVALKSRLGSGP
jgi:hypothetical protein